ncbi:MAG: transporter substrate-binding domain-containing protein [Beijerinckiaceae bacterium]|nr:transporter substrate-binding domain-containing protein [Beijerinckiaceae bacterium]
MVSRRSLAGVIAAGTVLAGGLATGALAQAPATSETTFERIRRTKKLRIGAVNAAAPYYQKDLASGEWKGFYIDLSKALATELEAELDIVETTWGNSVLDLQANKIDIFFGLNPTPKRALVVDFSVPVFNNAFTMITRKDFKATTWAELNDPAVKIAVDVGSSHDQVVSRLCPKATITRFKTTDEASLAVQSGRADAQCIILMLSLTVLKKNPSLGKLLVPTPVFSTTSNAGFHREADKTWRDYVNTWIDFNRGLGLVRQVIISNMELVGITEADMPAGISL